jgi:hypothetical protein
VTEHNVQNSNKFSDSALLIEIQGKKFFSNMSDVLSKNVTNFVGIKDEAKDVLTPLTSGTKAVEESGGLPLMQVRN